MREYTVREYDMEDYEYIRDNITDEEIISILEYIEGGYIPDWNFSKTENDYENYKLHIALWKAIDAIKAKMKK